MKCNVFKFLLKKIQKLSPYFIVVQLLSSFINVGIVLLGVYIPSIILNVLGEAKNSNEGVKYIACIFLIMLTLKFILIYLTKKTNIMRQMLKNYILGDINEQMLAVPYEKMEDVKFIDQLHDALYPINILSSIDQLFLALPKMLQHMLTIVGVLVIILNYNLWIIVVIFAVSILSIIINHYVMKIETKKTKDTLKYNKKYAYFIRTVKDPIISKDIRVYQMQTFFLSNIKELFKQYVTHGEHVFALTNIRTIIGTFLSIMLLIFMYGFLLMNLVKNGITPANLILIVNAATTLSLAIHNITNEMLVFNQNINYFAEYYKYDKMVKKETNLEKDALHEVIETIEFKDVVFSYPNTNEQVLKGINFKIDSEKTVSIVGKNGSGKTTVIKLLAKLYKPDSGVILINGKNLDELEISSYLMQLSIVFQDFKTFGYTIKDNIAFGRDDRNSYEEALKNSQFENELGKFSKGDDTYISKKFSVDGVMLSKGQEQKLVIARGLYKEASVIILDEPTASLDPIAEEEVYKNFSNITKNKLSVFISHRLSSCKNSDNIILLEKGQVKEEGTHKELMKLEGIYFYMFSLQGSKYT